MEKDVLLDIREAYMAMFVFLDRFYNQTKSDDVGALLGDMSFLADGGTADPATWYDWIESVKRVKDHPKEVDELVKLTLNP